ncbi:hypothetical protein OIV83_001333 [Microbotryomycetes sp. JL201]|nr:hypothetical protein OIV83_001333 [Microbotryomycetes sp. JL201]
MPSPVLSLKEVATTVLRAYWPLVTDVGDATFEQLAPLLPGSTATQLHEIEHNSPQIRKYTQDIWKQLCIKDFVTVRIAVEDGLMNQEPDSWREVHETESRKQKASGNEKMASVLKRMRGQYKEFADSKATTSQVDGVQMAKRRKLNSMVSGQTRPKSLFDKAKLNSRRIQKIYAPRQRAIKPQAAEAVSDARTKPALPVKHVPNSSMLRRIRPHAQPPLMKRTVALNSPEKKASLGDKHAREDESNQATDFRKVVRPVGVSSDSLKIHAPARSGRWGRNSENQTAPHAPEIDMVKRPRLVKSLNGMVLRDLVIADTYAGNLSTAAAVDANGDVIMWGSGFSEQEREPTATLRHRNIVKLVATSGKVFALSKKGELFVFPARQADQKVNEPKRNDDSAWWKFWAGKNPGTDVEEVKTNVPLASGEKLRQVVAGEAHLLALSSAGRTFAMPLDFSANSHGQLGVRRVQLLSLHPSTVSSGAVQTTLAPPADINDPQPIPMPKKLDPLLLPPSGKSPEPLGQPQKAISAPVIPVDNDGPADVASIAQDEQSQTALERDIRFCTVLHEIPALKGVKIAELAAGSRHSLARLEDGRVLGWGANGYGQLGLGATLAYPSIPAPTEIPIARNYSKATRAVCTAIAAGANLSYFVVDRTDIPTGNRTIDLLATGNGQFGGMGNGTWAHSPTPVKVKTISGLTEYNEASGRVEPIAIRDITVGNAHVAIVLDNAVEQPGGVKFGRDVFIWGHNMYHQLGTGKRSNLATPQHLPPLPYPGLVVDPAVAANAQLKQESMTSSGTTSPMPHSRLQLAPAIKVAGGKWAEETIVAGDGGTSLELRLRYLEALLVPPRAVDDDERVQADASMLRRVATINETLATALDSNHGTESIKRLIANYDLNEPLLRPQSALGHQLCPPDRDELSVASKIALLLDIEPDIIQLDKDLRQVQIFDEKDVAGAGNLADHQTMKPELEKVRERMKPLVKEYAALDDQSLALLDRYNAHISSLSERFVAWNDLLTAAEDAITKLEKQRSKPLDIE